MMYMVHFIFHILFHIFLYHVGYSPFCLKCYLLIAAAVAMKVFNVSIHLFANFSCELSSLCPRLSDKVADCVGRHVAVLSGRRGSRPAAPVLWYFNLGYL